MILKIMSSDDTAWQGVLDRSAKFDIDIRLGCDPVQSGTANRDSLQVRFRFDVLTDVSSVSSSCLTSRLDRLEFDHPLELNSGGVLTCAGILVCLCGS